MTCQAEGGANDRRCRDVWASAMSSGRAGFMARRHLLWLCHGPLPTAPLWRPLAGPGDGQCRGKSAQHDHGHPPHSIGLHSPRCPGSNGGNHGRSHEHSHACQSIGPASCQRRGPVVRRPWQAARSALRDGSLDGSAVDHTLRLSTFWWRRTRGPSSGPMVPSAAVTVRASLLGMVLWARAAGGAAGPPTPGPVPRRHRRGLFRRCGGPVRSPGREWAGRCPGRRTPAFRSPGAGKGSEHGFIPSGRSRYATTCSQPTRRSAARSLRKSGMKEGDPPGCTPES